MELVTVSAAAKVLGVKPQRVYQFIEGKRLAVETSLGRIGIKPSELERFKKIKRKGGRPKNGSERASKAV